MGLTIGLAIICFLFASKVEMGNNIWQRLSVSFIGVVFGAFLAIIISSILLWFNGTFIVSKQVPTYLVPVEQSYFTVVQHVDKTDVFYFRPINNPNYMTIYRLGSEIKDIKYDDNVKPALYRNYYDYKWVGWRYLLFSSGIVKDNDYTLVIPKGSIEYVEHK